MRKIIIVHHPDIITINILVYVYIFSLFPYVYVHFLLLVIWIHFYSLTFTTSKCSIQIFHVFILKKDILSNMLNITHHLLYFNNSIYILFHISNSNLIDKSLLSNKTFIFIFSQSCAVFYNSWYIFICTDEPTLYKCLFPGIEVFK